MANLEQLNILTPFPPDELYDLSMNLGYSSGTVSFTVDSGTDVSDTLTIFGLSCVVLRQGPSLSFSENAKRVECRISPAIKNLYASISCTDIGDGKLYSVMALVSDLASACGITISVLTEDKKVKSFKSQGRFNTILEALASELCGISLQQNTKWYILPRKTAIGDFSIDSKNLISSTASSETDNLDEAISVLASIISSAKQAVDIKNSIDDLQDLIDENKDDLKNAEAAVIAASQTGTTTGGTDTANTGFNVTYAEHMTNIVFQFGRVNNGSWQPIDSTILIEGIEFDTWEVTPETSLNVSNLEGAYYQIFQELDDRKTPTGNFKGLLSLRGADLLVPVEVPSNAGGQFFAKGTSSNMSFLSDNQNVWTNLELVQRSYTDPDTLIVETKFYFLFTPEYRATEIISIQNGSPTSIMAVTDAMIDKRVYSVNLEVMYIPAITRYPQFLGETSPSAWPVDKGGLIVGTIDVDGSFSDINGKMITEIHNINELPGSIVPHHCIMDTAKGGALACTSDGNTFVSMARTHCGIVDAFDKRIIRLGNNTSGVMVGYATSPLSIGRPWPGLRADVSGEVAVAVTFFDKFPSSLGYDFSTFDPDNPSDWVPVAGLDPLDQDLKDLNKVKTDLATQMANLVADASINASLFSCLTKELATFGVTVSLTALTTAYEEFQKEKAAQARLSKVDFSKLKPLSEAVENEEKALFATVSKADTTLVRRDFTFLYSGTMPLPGNQFSLGGIIQNASLALKSGSVSITTIEYKG